MGGATKEERARKLEADLRATLADYAAECDQGAVFDALYNIIVSEEFGGLGSWIDVLTERRDFGPGEWAEV